MSCCYSFPLSKHTGGGDTAPAFSGLHVCLQLTWEVGLPPSPVEFSSLHHSHKLSHSWLLGTHPCSSPLQPGSACLFTVLGGISPPPLFSAQGAPPSLLHVFIFLIAYYSFSLFSPGGCQSVQGAVLIWLRVVCGSTARHLTQPVVHVFPSCLCAGVWWWPGGSPGNSIQCEVRCSAQAGGVRSQCFASSQWPCLQGVSPASL
jgi:hypothetical protein